MVDEVTVLLYSWEDKLMEENYDTWPYINRLADLLNKEMSKNLSRYIQNRKFLKCSFIDSDLNMMYSLFFHLNSTEPMKNKTTCVHLLLCLAYATNTIFTESMQSNVIPSLIQWTKESSEPLQTYATGLLDFCISERYDFIGFVKMTDKKNLLNCLTDRLVSNHIPSRYENNVMWQLSPLNNVTKQIYIFKMLTSLARSKHLFPKFLECNKFMCVLRDCLGGSQGRHIVPLMVEARYFLAMLLTHESFALTFVDADDWIQLFTTNLCQPLILPSLICMINLSWNRAAMEHLFHTRPRVATDLTMCVLKLFDDADSTVRCKSMLFIDFAFRYETTLDLFDANDGSQKFKKLFEYIQDDCRNDMFKVLVAFEVYVTAHLLLKYRELCNQVWPDVMLAANDKQSREIVDALLKCVPFRWKPIEDISADFLQLVVFILKSKFNDKHSIHSLLKILDVLSLSSTWQLAICEKVLKHLLHRLECQTSNELRLSAIRIIANCVSIPIIKNGDNSVFENSRKTIRSSNVLMLMSEMMKPQKECSNDVKNMACKVLCVLAEDDVVKDIICKSTIYTNKYLQNFSNAELDTNIESNAHAKELLKLVEPMEKPKLLNVDKLKPSNVLIRLTSRERGIGKIGSELDKRVKCLKYRSFPSDCWSSINSPAMMDNYEITCIKYSFDQKNVIVCKKNGGVQMINLGNGIVSNYFYMKHDCNNIQFEKSGGLMLMECGGFSSLRINMNFESSLLGMQYDCVQFANWNPTRILASNAKCGAIVDTVTGTEVINFNPRFRNNYDIYKAVFSPDDGEILYDGVMLDGKSGETIFKFDKLNSVQNGFFHPYRQEVIINSEIWDLRTRKLMKFEPDLDRQNVIFGAVDNILFTVSQDRRRSHMRMIDADTYNTSCVRKVFNCDGKFDVDKRNTSIVVAERLLSNMEIIVKLYHIGGRPLKKDIY